MTHALFDQVEQWRLSAAGSGNGQLSAACDVIDELDDAIRDALDFLPYEDWTRCEPKKAAIILHRVLEKHAREGVEVAPDPKSRVQAAIARLRELGKSYPHVPKRRS